MHRYYRIAILLCLLAALGIASLAAEELQPPAALGQISPLSPLGVQAPGEEAQPQTADTPTSDSPLSVPLVRSGSGQQPTRNVDVPLGKPLEAQTSLLLVGAVLIGLVLLVVLVLVRRHPA